MTIENKLKELGIELPEPLEPTALPICWKEFFGERGRHPRSAVGVNELAFNNMPVEIEMILRIKK